MTDEQKPPWEDPAEADTRPNRYGWDASRRLFADVNRWHHDVQWDAYARACPLVGVKVSQGGVLAQFASELVRSAEARGLIVVGFNYAPTHAEDFLRYFPPAPGRIPCLDFEGLGDFPDEQAHPDDKLEWQLTHLSNAYSFVQRVHAAYGRWPWFYANAHREWAACGAPTGSVLELCPWWGPQYGGHLSVPDGVGQPVAWQYSEGKAAGPVGAPRVMPGIGPCDTNALLVSMEELRAMAGL